MNKRIKELLVEAEKSVQFLSNSPDSKKQITMEKFAELIIQECISQLNIPNVPGHVLAGLNLGKVAIKENLLEE